MWHRDTGTPHPIEWVATACVTIVAITLIIIVAIIDRLMTKLMEAYYHEDTTSN